MVSEDEYIDFHVLENDRVSAPETWCNDCKRDSRITQTITFATDDDVCTVSGTRCPVCSDDCE